MLGTVPQQHSLTFLEKLFILRLVHSTNFTLHCTGLVAYLPKFVCYILPELDHVLGSILSGAPSFLGLHLVYNSISSGVLSYMAQLFQASATVRHCLTIFKVKIQLNHQYIGNGSNIAVHKFIWA